VPRARLLFSEMCFSTTRYGVMTAGTRATQLASLHHVLFRDYCFDAALLPAVRGLPQVTGLPGAGGGFALDMMPIMEVSDCTFGGNTASEVGGGMYLAGAATSIVNALNLTCDSGRSSIAHEAMSLVVKHRVQPLCTTL
jgi:hypothetical protein